MATFQPSETLRSRTFIALLAAQFLAAFNDQAIHASAMFFAIDQRALNEAQAIALMPILFYAPWALFCTLAGYLADRFSKRNSLIFWKFAEVGITLVACLGFFLGGGERSYWYSPFGPWIVLSTVFLMGTHSAFFVPAKYGVMPEILQPNMLSRGNGLLESLSFLAVILGTVSGGVLSDVFKTQEYMIGVVLVTLAVIGAAASLLIQYVPAANPNRSFPPLLYKPLFQNIRLLLRSRPLTLAVIGIAFFTFLVTFMRSTVYMHGETSVPMWSESDTSKLFGLVALGIGLGSPLVGYLSGGKVELGLVPLGALGMIVATLFAAVFLDSPVGLIVCLVGIGFCTGFYIVPLFTLLQHRAPKASKGDTIATSNFINVTGAILASLVFYLLTTGATYTGIAPVVPPDREPIVGTLSEDPAENKNHQPISVKVGDRVFKASPEGEQEKVRVIRVDAYNLLELGKGLKKGDEVVETKYKIDDVIMHQTRSFSIYDPWMISSYKIDHVIVHQIRRKDQPEIPMYDKRGLPKLLFIAAACITLFTLWLVRRELPDIYMRTRLWFRWRRRATLEVYGMQQLPDNGPIILATNATTMQMCLQIVTSTDRMTRFLCVERFEDKPLPPVLGALVSRYSLAVISENNSAKVDWQQLSKRADEALAKKEVVGVSVEDPVSANLANPLIEIIGPRHGAAILPVYCETPESEKDKLRKEVYIVVGSPLVPGTCREAVAQEIERLGADFKEQHRLGTLQQMNHAGVH